MKTFENEKGLDLICPLSYFKKGHQSFVCDKERCAWWIEETPYQAGCAILKIAEKLKGN